MALSKPATTPNTSRKVLKLAIAVVAVMLLYTGGWYWAATALDDRLQRIFEARNPENGSVECANRQLHGFPFRIGLFCKKVAIDDHRNGVAASFGAFRSAAQIYNPGHILWELDGPGEVRTTAGGKLSLDWGKLRSSVVTAFTGIDRSSLEADNLNAKLTPLANAPTFDMTASHLETHVRRSDGDLQYAGTVRDLAIASPDDNLTLPPVSATLEATLDGQEHLLDFGQNDLENLYGLRGRITHFVADLGDGRIMTLSGPISVGNTGLISGDVKIEIENLSGWLSEARTFRPDIADDIENATRLMSALTGGKDKVKLDLRIDDGLVSLGILPLGQIPPL